MPATKIVVAKESFVTTHDGRELLISAGTRVRANHPLGKAHPDLFELVEPRADIEQATAAPSMATRPPGLCDQPDEPS